MKQLQLNPTCRRISTILLATTNSSGITNALALVADTVGGGRA